MMQIFSKLIPTTPTFNLPTNSIILSPENNLNTYFLVDQHVRSLMFLFTIYFPEDFLWMSCAISFDFLPGGIIIPGVMDFKIFKPNIYSDTQMIINDVIRLIIVLLFLVFMVMEYRRNADKQVKSHREYYLDNLFSNKTCLNLFIFILFMICFVTKLVYCYNDEKDYLDLTKVQYKDSYSVASKYNQVFYLESFLFAAVSLKILAFLKLNSHIKLYFTSLELAISVFFKYSIFFVMIMLGYASIGYIIWGPYIEEFGSIGDSFLQILLFTMGKKLIN
jgi:hypothetical protein